MDRRAALLGSVVAAVVATALVLTRLPTVVTLFALVGPCLAGVLSDPEKFDGAVEGAVAAGVAVPLTMIAVAVGRLFVFQGVDSPLQVLWLTGGPQAIGGIFIVFPLALVVGALAGWGGRLVRDPAGGAVSVAGS